jgi:hypothetical protein
MVPGDHDGDYRGGGAIPTWEPIVEATVECPVCERAYGRRPPIILLHALWHEAQDVGWHLTDAFPVLLNVLHDQRWLTDDEYALWQGRLGHCPEYLDKPPGEHCGGRAWCAYCGTVSGFQTTLCGRCDKPGTKTEIPEYASGVGLDYAVRLCAECFAVMQEEVAAKTRAAHRDAQATGTLPAIVDQHDPRPIPTPAEMINWKRRPEDA